MAIAGGMTTAYTVMLWNGELKISQTTAPWDMCYTASSAVSIVRSGSRATVAGSDMVEFRKLWKLSTTVAS